jgi:hypothetical protein
MGEQIWKTSSHTVLWWLSFVEQWLLTVKYHKASIIFTLLLVTETDVASFLLVIHQLSQMTSIAFWSSIQMTAAIGWLELHESLSFAWRFSEPTICEAQWLTVLFLTALTFYTFLNCWWLLLTDSFSATKFSNSPLLDIHITILRTSSTCARKCVFPWHCSKKCTFIINHKKTADIFCWFWLKYRKGCKTFWATLIQDISINSSRCLFIAGQGYWLSM